MTLSPSSRRVFLKQSTAALAGSTLASGLVVPQVHAQGNDLIRIGLVGCGGRGAGAAKQVLTADRYTRLVAVADAFEDRLQAGLRLAGERWRGGKARARRPRPSIRRLRWLQASHQLGRGRGAAGHTSPFPAHAPESGDRGGQARLRREAGGRRCPRRPFGAGNNRAGQTEKPARSCRGSTRAIRPACKS